jgi:hypothetical protein
LMSDRVRLLRLRLDIERAGWLPSWWARSMAGGGKDGSNPESGLDFGSRTSGVIGSFESLLCDCWFVADVLMVGGLDQLPIVSVSEDA